MESKEFSNEYSIVINHSKEFKAVASYLLIAENPTLRELEEYVAKITKTSDFTLWELLKSYTGLDNDYIESNNLVGFFKYLGINELEKFFHNKIGQNIFDYLKCNQHSVRIFKDLSNLEKFDKIKFTCNYTKMYFYHEDGFYSSRDLDFFSNRCSMLNQDLLEISRIEKEIDGEWLPVIINENGKFFSLTEITG